MYQKPIIYINSKTVYTILKDFLWFSNLLLKLMDCPVAKIIEHLVLQLSKSSKLPKYFITVFSGTKLWQISQAGFELCKCK